MAEGFAPMAREAFREGFAPTCLIDALDAARREAAMAERAPPPDAVAAVIAEARRAALEEGRARGLDEAAAAQQALVVRAGVLALEALREGRAAAAAAAGDAAAEVARLALGMLDAALPGLAAENGAALAAAFARRLAPMLEAAPEARLLVAPGMAEATRELLAGAAIAIEEDAALPPGDARAEWRAGGAAFDLAARRREIRGVLEAAGFGPRE